MIIIKVNGGLGNQLQQYALYEKYKSLNKEVKLDLSWFETDSADRKLELSLFPNIRYQECTKKEFKQIQKYSGKWVGKITKALSILGWMENPKYVECQMYTPDIFQLDNKILEGYWACEAYYRDILPILHERLVFPPITNVQNQEMLQKIASTNSVSIHLRRGDYLEKQNKDIFGGICTQEYYDRAIQFINDNVEKPHFFVFSDDIEYATSQYDTGNNDEFTIVDINHGPDSFWDILLMKSCRHNICANSTFSFWGARLNDKDNAIRIRPLKQRNNCDWYDRNRMVELWPDWVLIDENGNVVEK